MTPEQIRAQRDFWYKAIRAAEDELKKLRLLCRHENTFEGLYSWRLGSQEPAKICSDCGEVVKFLNLNLFETFPEPEDKA